MREFRKAVGKSSSKTKRPQVWRIEQKGNKVTVSWGVLDGAMQSTTQTFAGNNIGKKNEKSPEQVAEEELERQVEGQLSTGWHEVDPKTGATISKEVITELDFVTLPKNLRFWKPRSKPAAGLKEKIDKGEAIWTRKRDGMQHSLLYNMNGEWKMYSSLMAPAHKDEPEIPWLERYPQIQKALSKLIVPKGTVFVGELVTAFERNKAGFDIDSLVYVSTIVKSKFEEAVLKQTNGGWLTFCGFDIPFWGTKPWYKEVEVSRRLGAIHELLINTGDAHLSHVEIFLKDEVIHAEGREAFDFDGSYKDAMAIARGFEWEGFVALDPKATYDNEGITFAGKAERPLGAGKVKLKKEADFVVYWDPEKGQGQWGKGKKSKGVGSVAAYLYDEETKELRYIAKVGGGLTDEDVIKFADPKLYPMVWKVEFMRWTPNGSIREPEFVEVRTDKKPEECTTEQIEQGDDEEDSEE